MLKKIALALVATTLLTAPVLARNNQPNQTPSTATAPAGTTANSTAGKTTAGTAASDAAQDTGNKAGASTPKSKHRHAAQHVRRHRISQHSRTSKLALHKSGKAQKVRVSRRAAPQSTSATRSGT